MIVAPMCFFSVLQSPRCRIYTLANCLHGWTGTFGTSSKKPVNFRIWNGRTDKWTRRSVTTSSGGNKAAWSSEARSIKREILEISQLQKIPNRETEEKEREKESDRVTVIVFDIETTGFKRDTARIIEFACRDLSGGENSTFQTLVNPGCPIYNSDCHGITSDMVNKPHIPRISDFIPIFLRYLKSRQKHGGPVILVAHNARAFDVPFLIHEFKRCSMELPSDWLFLDTCPLAREMKKLNGIEGKISLQSLSQEFEIPVVGSAHRAMADVDCLSQVFQRLTIFLKLSRSDLVGKSFTVSDLKK